MFGRFASCQIVLALGVSLLAFTASSDASARKFRTLYSFAGGADGANPQASLILDRAGNLYGTTFYGGAQNLGTVFMIEPDGTEKVLHSFEGNDGAYPYSDLIADADGVLYGTTAFGGPSNTGVVFKLTPDGVETVLYSFAKHGKGVEPLGRVAFGRNGNLIGTAYGGGRGDCEFAGCGVVFELGPDGKEKVLHQFLGSATDGASPYGGVIIDKKGNIYGTTLSGGIVDPKHCLEPYPGCGTIFKLAPDGTEAILHYFSGGDHSACPVASLTPDNAGNLFGTTIGCGSPAIAFKLASDGAEAKDDTFTTFPLEKGSESSLAVDAAGNLYGTTIDGGSWGTIFKIAPDGTQTVLHTLSQSKGEGWRPLAGLIEDNEGNLYGTTSRGGAYDKGTVFELEK
jgi:uncharacterized repeat protein (TIGR03803 family)